MKIHVVHDAKGKILAAIRLNPDPNVPQLRPMPGRGHSSAELEVPLEHQATDFKTLCETMRVDAKKKMLVAATKKKR
jgi:hypothetical protein